ncbi:hypothetical protein MMC20_002573 [Loxospora ochrophaea]|nr:hypothetical protein [Loxospora ochrophaea]
MIEASNFGLESMKKLLDRKKASWARTLKERQGFVKENTQTGSKLKFDSKNAIGSYIVKCKAFEQGWDLGDQELTLGIESCFHGLQGGFDSGVVEGVMLFARDEQSLSKIVDELQEDDEEDEEELEEDSSSEHSEASAQPSTSHATSKKRGATEPFPSARATKKSKLSTPSKLDRLYLQWRGRETGEGEIELDYDNEHRGYLDFTDAACTQFKGVACFPLVADKVEFRGLQSCHHEQFWM